MDGWTIGTLLETATGYLREKGSGSPRLDAELLLAQALGMDRIHLYTEYDRPLDSCEVDHYRSLIGRRGKREPVAYILGQAHFRHLVLEVTPAVLIPRPETEELVDVALGVLRRKPFLDTLTDAASTGDTTVPLLIADVGCGSGAIALSIAQESGSRVLATDLSPDALAVASRNRDSLELDPLVELRTSDLLDGVPDASLRLIVSNPPYIPSADMEGLEPDVRSYEPLMALEAGADGLTVYRRLLPEAARVLGPGGTLLVEVGDGQAGAVAGLAGESGFAAISIHKDLSGKERIVEAALPGTEVVEFAALNDGRASALALALRAGAIVGLPTDTVYGLAASWDSREGVKRLFSAKGRGEAQPVAVLFASVEAIKGALPDLDAAAARVLEALLPGPFTFVVATSVSRPALVGTEDSLGVRVPDHPPLLRFLESLGVAVAATSANVSGQPAAATLAQVDPSVLAHCSAALVSDGGVDLRGVASTVVDLRPLSQGGRAVVLREGAVAADEVLRRIDALG
jgi:release factor glutamine methyltransferase